MRCPVQPAATRSQARSLTLRCSRCASSKCCRVSARARPNKQIATELGLSEKTVKAHVTAIFKVLGVVNPDSGRARRPTSWDDHELGSANACSPPSTPRPSFVARKKATAARLHAAPIKRYQLARRVLWRSSIRSRFAIKVRSRPGSAACAGPADLRPPDRVTDGSIPVSPVSNTAGISVLNSVRSISIAANVGPATEGRRRSRTIVGD